MARPYDGKPYTLVRREFLTRTVGAGGFVAGLRVLTAGELVSAPSAMAATAFGYTSSGGYYTGAWPHLQDPPAQRRRASGSELLLPGRVRFGSGTLHHYLVVVNGQNNIYMATYVNSSGGGELRRITRLNPSAITTVLTPAEVNGGTAIESTDIYLLDGQTRSKYYSNRQAMGLTVRGVTGSGVDVYMAYGNRESSAGATDNQLCNYLWSAHDQTEPQRLNVLYGPYAPTAAATRCSPTPCRPAPSSPEPTR